MPQFHPDVYVDRDGRIAILNILDPVGAVIVEGTAVRWIKGPMPIEPSAWLRMRVEPREHRDVLS